MGVYGLKFGRWFDTLYEDLYNPALLKFINLFEPDSPNLHQSRMLGLLLATISLH